MGVMMCVLYNAGDEKALAAGLVKALLGLGAAVFSQARALPRARRQPPARLPPVATFSAGTPASPQPGLPAPPFAESAVPLRRNPRCTWLS